jgi:phenylalanyl-tRNA synthetase beta chain
MVVDESVSSDAIRACVGQAGVDVLDNLELFDVYRGEGIDSGKKSLAIGLSFRHGSRSLVDEEVEEGFRTIVSALETRLGAVLRG